MSLTTGEMHPAPPAALLKKKKAAMPPPTPATGAGSDELPPSTHPQAATRKDARLQAFGAVARQRQNVAFCPNGVDACRTEGGHDAEVFKSTLAFCRLLYSTLADDMVKTQKQARYALLFAKPCDLVVQLASVEFAHYLGHIAGWDFDAGEAKIPGDDALAREQAEQAEAERAECVAVMRDPRALATRLLDDTAEPVVKSTYRHRLLEIWALLEVNLGLFGAVLPNDWRVELQYDDDCAVSYGRVSYLVQSLAQPVLSEPALLSNLLARIAVEPAVRAFLKEEKTVSVGGGFVVLVQEKKFGPTKLVLPPDTAAVLVNNGACNCMCRAADETETPLRRNACIVLRQGCLIHSTGLSPRRRMGGFRCGVTQTPIIVIFFPLGVKGFDCAVQATKFVWNSATAPQRIFELNGAVELRDLDKSHADCMRMAMGSLAHSKLSRELLSGRGLLQRMIETALEGFFSIRGRMEQSGLEHLLDQERSIVMEQVEKDLYSAGPLSPYRLRNALRQIEDDFDDLPPKSQEERTAQLMRAIRVKDDDDTGASKGKEQLRRIAALGGFVLRRCQPWVSSAPRRRAAPKAPEPEHPQEREVNVAPLDADVEVDVQEVPAAAAAPKKTRKEARELKVCLRLIKEVEAGNLKTAEASGDADLIAKATSDLEEIEALVDECKDEHGDYVIADLWALHSKRCIFELPTPEKLFVEGINTPKKPKKAKVVPPSATACLNKGINALALSDATEPDSDATEPDSEPSVAPEPAAPVAVTAPSVAPEPAAVAGEADVAAVARQKQRRERKPRATAPGPTRTSARLRGRGDRGAQ